MIELIAVHEPELTPFEGGVIDFVKKLKADEKEQKDDTQIRANHGQLPRTSFTENGIYYRLIGYVESKHGALLGKYEPVIEPSLIKRSLKWIKK